MVGKRTIDEEGDGSICSPLGFKQSRLLPTQLALTETDQRILETFLRKWVREEVERKFMFYHHKIYRFPDRRIEASERNFQLSFNEKLSLPIFTGSRIKTEGGRSMQIVILDSSGAVITSGPLSSLRVEVVILRGDFASDDQEDWTEEDFVTSIVREREGKRPLLVGDTVISMKDGVGNIGELNITDNSCWMPSRKFRLGARVFPGSRVAERIREAKTEAFPVKDHRGESYKKHYPPTLNDEVWRLENIMKGGIFHQRLAGKGINTVEELLRHLSVCPELLRSVLGMSNKQWESTILHAKTCIVSSDVSLSISVGPDHQVVLLFNSIYEVTGILLDGHIRSIHDLDIAQKELVDDLAKEAYRNWRAITEPQKLRMPDGAPCTRESNHSLQNQTVQMSMFASHQDQSGKALSIMPIVSTDNVETSPARTLYDPLQRSDFAYENCCLEEDFIYKDNLEAHHFPFSYALVQSGNVKSKNSMHHSNDWLLASNSDQENQNVRGQFGGHGRKPSLAFGGFMSRKCRATLGWRKLRAVLLWVIVVRRDAAARKWSRVSKFLQC